MCLGGRVDIPTNYSLEEIIRCFPDTSVKTISPFIDDLKEENEELQAGLNSATELADKSADTVSKLSLWIQEMLVYVAFSGNAKDIKKFINQSMKEEKINDLLDQINLP
jgi:hypothetical protein